MEILHDLSIPVRLGTPEWPGDTPFSCGWTGVIEKGSSVNLSTITTSPHVGTHADSPLHVRSGDPGTDELPLEAFVGPAFLLDVSSKEGEIEFADIAERLPATIERLLLRTGRSTASGEFPESFPTLSAACISELCHRGLRLLGVDSPSVDQPESKTLDAHHALFGGGGYNIESLDLTGVPEGEHYLVALPWRLAGLDAAPTRAVLVTPP